ncbi:MAG: GTP 3',8-cyclase MoaA [Candidatus Marinimicrobia bacterium]|jgi:cyclic pyranopterin phosphate synthase|nr:GTP 3',8-cyclase MoaA [Candidatus Neomarinimicrobiota bacterium]MBT7946055.1 GTP 3',8-cyclase MoaA [Candidatus Neomarinimicrobiota bacterium]
MIENIITPTPINGELDHSAPPIIDRFGRSFNYLRLALNEQCNLRCIYCMPEEGIDFRSEDKLLTTEEIFRLIKLTSKMGVSKIRFTGGEPLLRKDLSELVQFAHQCEGIESVHLTTNGLLLSKRIEELEKSGLSGINISLDTLDTDKFKKITRRDGLDMVLNSLQKALASNIQSIKLNIVAMRDFNDDELMDFVELTKDNDITVRFIELMPFDSHQIWKTGKFYGADDIVADIKKQVDALKPIDGSRTEHHIFRVNDYKGKVAVIPAYSRSLCGECNRIRITADGKLLNCLYSQDETNLRDAMRTGKTDMIIKEMIYGTMKKKFKDGWEAQKQGNDNRESMTQIGG